MRNAKIYNSVTELKVAGNNELNKQINKFLPKTIDLLSKFKGQKIKLADSSYSKAFNVELRKLQNSTPKNVRLFLHISKYSIWVKFDVNIIETEYATGWHGVAYFDKELHAGNMVNGQILSEELSDLKTLETTYNLKKRYTVKKQLKLIEDQKVLKEKIRIVENQIL